MGQVHKNIAEVATTAAATILSSPPAEEGEWRESEIGGASRLSKTLRRWLMIFQHDSNNVGIVIAVLFR